MAQLKNMQQFKFKQKGVTLMELIAGLAIMAVVVTGALALYTSASSSEASTSITKDLHAIREATKQLYSGQGTYGVATTNLNDTLVAAKKVPTSISVDTTTTPDTLTHKKDGTINVASTGASFSVTLTNIPVDVCMPLMTSAAGWTSVKGGTATARTTFPVTPEQAQADCATGTTMIFTN